MLLYDQRREALNEPPAAFCSYLDSLYDQLRNEFHDTSGADDLSAFADGEVHARFQRDGLFQLNRQLDVVARQNHGDSLRKRDRVCDVGRAEEKLRRVIGKERRVTTAFRRPPSPSTSTSSPRCTTLRVIRPVTTVPRPSTLHTLSTGR